MSVIMNGQPPAMDYAARLEAFRRSDAERDALVAELISQLESLKVQYREKADDYNNEVESRRMWQSKAASSETMLMQHKQQAAGNNFVLAVIDGDGAVFQDYLYSSGKEGGADAAHQLHTEIKTHLKSIYPDANVSDWTVVVQVVLNLQGLANKLQSCGIISDRSDMHQFGSSFNLTHPLFSFLDVGSGKERADHKIREILRLYVPNAQCKHVFFAPCHDNGYLPTLESMRRDPAVASRITLVETRPAERGFLELGLRRVQFPQIFRTEDLPASRPVQLPMRPPLTTISNGSNVNNVHNVHNVGSPQVSITSLANVPKAASPSPSTESQASSAPPNANSASWAAMGKNTSTKTINIAPKKTPTRPFIVVNVHDERLDPDLPRSDHAAEARYGKRVEAHGKYCNNYHLTGKCDAGQYCDYYHGEKLSPGEVLVLKHKARSRSCPEGVYCDDIDCTFGHVCKYGPGCTKPSCYFSSTHGMDMEPAKRMFADGTTEWLPAYLAKYQSK